MRFISSFSRDEKGRNIVHTVIDANSKIVSQALKRVFRLKLEPKTACKESYFSK